MIYYDECLFPLLHDLLTYPCVILTIVTSTFIRVMETHQATVSWELQLGSIIPTFGNEGEMN